MLRNIQDQMRKLIELWWEYNDYRDWFEFLIDKLNETKDFKLEVSDERFIELVEEYLRVNEEEELKTYVDDHYYSDCIGSYQYLIDNLDLSFWIAAIAGQWAIAYYKLWDDMIVLTDWFLFQHDSYKELREYLEKIESMVNEFIL
jgi:hypothetical protein